MRFLKSLGLKLHSCKVVKNERDFLDNFKLFSFYKVCFVVLAVLQTVTNSYLYRDLHITVILYNVAVFLHFWGFSVLSVVVALFQRLTDTRPMLLCLPELAESAETDLKGECAAFQNKTLFCVEMKNKSSASKTILSVR